MTDGERERLLATAFAAGRNSYSPYSRYPVGAAVLCTDGTVYSGCNVENVSYPAGICAERNALGSAVAAGKRHFKALAVCGSKESYTMPCGICLQWLAEFRIPLILSAKSETDYQEFRLEELLPHAFAEEGLKDKGKI